MVCNVPSSSREDTHYTVTYVGGEWSCTCPDFFYRAHKPECKHITRAKERHMTASDLFEHIDAAGLHVQEALRAVRRGEVTPEDARVVRGLGRTLFRYTEALSDELIKLAEREGK
jgi:predicted nucleic acid-binding Zn finger protein